MLRVILLDQVEDDRSRLPDQYIRVRIFHGGYFAYGVDAAVLGRD